MRAVLAGVVDVCLALSACLIALLLRENHDLRAALDAMLSGKPVTEKQKPSMGCNIKWTPGNEPGYFNS